MKIKKHCLSLTFLLVFSIVVSCELEKSNAPAGKIFYDPKSEKVFNLEDRLQVNQLAESLIKEKITLLGDASVVDLIDSKGDFKAISVRYQAGEVFTRMVIPLSEIPPVQAGLKPDDTKGNTYYVVSQSDCQIKCSVVYPCSECALEIIERCKTQTCTCGQDGTGCSTSVVFNE